MFTEPYIRETNKYELFDVLGMPVQFLSTPEEVKDGICLLRGAIPPGGVVPLHRHPDPEIVYILEGSLQVFRSNVSGSGWTSVGMGDVVTVPGNVRHAIRNRSCDPATAVTVTRTGLYDFYREVAIPFDPAEYLDLLRTGVGEFSVVADRYGYWLAPPAENAAIGLPIGQFVPFAAGELCER